MVRPPRLPAPPRPPRSWSPAFLALVVLPTLAAPAAAQLDLPIRDGRKPPQGLAKAQRGTVAPHLVCSVCYERNYTTPIDHGAENGLQKAWCNICRAARLHYVPRRGGKGRNGGVDLPADPRLRRPGSPGRAGAAPPPGTEAPALGASADRGTPASPAGTGIPPAGTGIPPAGTGIPPDPTRDAGGHLGRAAQDILRELIRARSIDDPLVLQATETLLALGDAGRASARLALASDHAPTMITGLRVLLRGDDPLDSDLVVRRLGTRMPTRGASAAVAELIALDPVRATPRLLCKLLAHPQTPVRLAAHRALAKAPRPELVPLLEPLLDSAGSDARYKAVDLLARIDHPGAIELLLDSIDDPRARVARRAVEAVAARDDPQVEFELLTRAFGERWVLRSGAYALLTLIEREDRLLVASLHENHVEELLRGLDARDEFVSGVCAAALAGIGFRTEHPEASPWLDDVVPARLVEVVAGFRFFDDYEALRGPALRRLKQITGAAFGSDGPAWAQWWIADRAGFRASRAMLTVAPGEERQLRLAFRDAGAGTAFVLLGPDQAPHGAPARDGEPVYLSAEEALDLVELLRAEGLFGIDRLPGVRGDQLDRARTLELHVGQRGKSFTFGPRVAEPWFDRVVGSALALRERNLWQRFPHPTLHGSRLALYRAEGAWWSGDHSEEEREARLEELILARLLALSPAEREDGLGALVGLLARGARLAPTDFPVFLRFLQEEPYLTARTRRIVDLARASAGLPPGGAAPPGEQVREPAGELAGEPAGEPTGEPADGPSVIDRGWTLIATLHDHFGSDAAEEIGKTLVGLGDTETRAAAADRRPLVRAVSAHVLARSGDEGDVEVLLRLLEDPAEEVEVAAIQALGHARLQAALSPLLMRAGLRRGEVRDAALRAIGRLGGDDAREVLITALAESAGRHHLAAAEGLAALADPSTVPILLSLLRSGSHPEVHPAVRGGLLSLREDAWNDLFLAMRSPSPELRRDAALLLAHQGVPNAAPALMRALSEDPADVQVARELAVLTCVDQRGQTDPAEAWYMWWDGVRHDDSLVWLLAAAEARGIGAPAPEAFTSGGTRDAVGFLVQTMGREEPWLAERARRELERLLGRGLDDPPPVGPQRDAWLTTLLEVLEESR